MSSINVTPLTDVLLVLLITFLLSASSFQEVATEVPLPRVASAREVAERMTRVGVDQRGAVDFSPDLAGLAPPEAFARLRSKSEKPILALAVHRDLPYGALYPILVAAQKGGWSRIVLLTEAAE
jgi:biopolymer transport protein TolR